MRSCLIALALICLASCHTSDSSHSSESDETYYEVTHSPNHHRHYARPHSSKTFLLPSGRTYSIKNPHESKSVPCLPGAKVVEIKNVVKHYKAEYNMVVNEFTKSNNDTSKKFRIEKVEKVFNGCWLQKYSYRQKQVTRDLADGEDINEKMVFHGTSNAHIVAQEGFDERLAKKELDFGAGIYFSDHSSKANERSKTNRHGLREVMLCRVTLGKKYMAASLKKYAHPPVGFDSVVSGSRYVIYRGEQAYPDYIITFKEM